MTTFAYFFEARSIQGYIVRSDKLADMVAASQIVDEICTRLLPDTLTQLGYSNDTPEDIFSWIGVEFSRGDGGSFNAFFSTKEKAQKFQTLWSLAVSQFAPGLEWIDTRQQGEDYAKAADKAFTALGQQRNLPKLQLPEAGPFVQRAPRTGNAANSLIDDYRAEKAKSKEWLDRETLRKRAIKGEAAGVANKFISDDESTSYIWPRNLEYQTDDEQSNTSPEKRFPFNTGNRYIGVIHADGNGLGLLLNQLSAHTKQKPNSFLPLYRKFSAAISKANKTAAQNATKQILLPNANGNTLAARPLILGGDDLTIIVRADLAISFARSFIQEFEKASKKELQILKKDFKNTGGESTKKFPSKLTAAAGIAFVRSSQPFSAAVHLAESICTHVKNTTTVKTNGKIDDKATKPSALAFYRPTTSLLDDYSDLLEKTETSTHDGIKYRHLHNAYLLQNDDKAILASLTQLEKLLNAANDEALSKGPIRELLTLSYDSPQQMEKRYSRWRDVLNKGSSKQRDALSQFDDALQAFKIDAKTKITQTIDDSEITTELSPLGDLDTLMAINHWRPA